jgi:hypothetical protein
MNDNSAATRDLVFQYIVEYKRQHDGLSPSITEMARALSMNRTTARYHVLMLEHEGRIRLVGRRAIEVIGGAWNLPEGDESSGGGTSDDDDAPDERRAPK